MTTSYHAQPPLLKRLVRHAAILIYPLVAVLITYPLIFHLSTHLYGRLGDSPLFIWLAWWRKYSWLHDLPYSFTTMAQAPFGTDQVFIAYPGMIAGLALLGLPLGEVAAYNVLRLMAYGLTGCLAYFATYTLTSDRRVSLLGGLIFAFSPYATLQSEMRSNTAQLWVLPLCLLALIYLRRKQTPLAAMLLGAAFGVSFYFEIYYVYQIIVMMVIFVLVEGVMTIRQAGWKALLDRRWGLYALAGGVGIVLSLPGLLPILRQISGSANSPLRPTSLLIRPDIWYLSLSSRPWDFFLPPENHPVMGSLSQSAYDTITNLRVLNFRSAALEERFGRVDANWFWWTSTDTEVNSLYLGYMVLALAVYAVIRWRRGKLNRISVDSSPISRLWIPFLVVTVIAALLFTLPPYLPVGAFLRPLWTPAKEWILPTPALLTMTFLQPLRITRRFVALALLALALLAGAGLHDLLSRIRHPRWQAVTLAGVILVVAFEYVHPPVLTDIAPGEEIEWLADQEAGSIVAVYPVYYGRSFIWQAVHEQPMLNTTVFDANFMRDNLHNVMIMAASPLTREGAPSKLAALDVRYVILYNQSQLPESIEGVEPVMETEKAQVLEVTAEPAPVIVLYTYDENPWLSDAAWGWQGEQFSFYVWNPLNEAVAVDVWVELAGSSEQDLLASRRLTPHPEEIVFSGLAQPNPNIPPDYDPQPDAAHRDGAARVLRSLIFQPGETTVILTWSPAGEAPFPRVTGIRFDIPDPAGR